MKQKEALKVLNNNRKYLDDDVFDSISNDIEADLDKEEEELAHKINTLVDEGLDLTTIKNFLLSKYNSDIWFKYV